MHCRYEFHQNVQRTHPSLALRLYLALPLLLIAGTALLTSSLTTTNRGTGQPASLVGIAGTGVAAPTSQEIGAMKRKYVQGLLGDLEAQASAGDGYTKISTTELRSLRHYVGTDQEVSPVASSRD